VTGDREKGATLSGYAPAEASQLNWEIRASLAVSVGKSRKDLPGFDVVFGLFLFFIVLVIAVVVEVVVFFRVFGFVVEQIGPHGSVRRDHDAGSAGGFGFSALAVE
jgi:hypothetical protein